MENKPRGFRLVPITEVEMRAPVALIHGVLVRDTLALLYGDSASGKSFLGVSLSYAVSTGLPWFRRKVRQGPVVYIAGEGQSGIRRRFAAIEQYQGVPLPPNLFLHEGVVGLVNDDSADTVVDAITTLSEPPALVVLDTLARTFGPGDENSTEDMSAFVAAVDRIREAAQGATVLIIHHTGLTVKDRARGSYALQCGVDEGFEVTKRADGQITLLGKKSKDTGPVAPMLFRLRGMELTWPNGDVMRDEDGEIVTSCVLDEAPPDIVPGAPTDDPRLVPGEEYNAIILKKQLGLSDKAASQLLNQLVKAGALVASLPGTFLKTPSR